jgi:hypothetical protein
MSAVDLQTQNADLKSENRTLIRERENAKFIKGDVYRKARLSDYFAAENKRLELLANVRKDALVKIALGEGDPVELARAALWVTQEQG